MNNIQPYSKMFDFKWKKHKEYCTEAYHNQIA